MIDPVFDVEAVCEESGDPVRARIHASSHQRAFMLANKKIGPVKSCVQVEYHDNPLSKALFAYDIGPLVGGVAMVLYRLAILFLLLAISQSLA